MSFTFVNLAAVVFLALPLLSNGQSPSRDFAVPTKRLPVPLPGSSVPAQAQQNQPQTAGIVRVGDWANYLTTGLLQAEFVQRVQTMFDKQGLRLDAIDTYQENGQTRWVGVHRSGNWANRFVYGLSLPDFLKTAQSYFDKDGLRVTDLETYEEGGQVKWAAVLRAGDWANYLKYDLSAADFLKETQTMFDKQGLRLADMVTYMDKGQRKWAGVYQSGNWAHRTLLGMTEADFIKQTQELFNKDGLRLIKAITYMESGQRRWAGICRSGDWANYFLHNRPMNQFVTETQQLFNKDGLRVVSIDVY